MMKNILICLVFTTLVFTSFTPDQLIKTNMTIVVVNEQGAVVEGATVRLFKTINDYNNHKNQVQETKESNEKGVVKFTNIDAISYYLQTVSYTHLTLPTICSV